MECIHENRILESISLLENFKFNVFSIFLKMNEILVCFFLLLFCRKCMEKITSWINSSFLYISLCSLFISFLNLFVEIYTYFLNTAYCFRSYPIMNKICTHFSSYWFVFIYIQNELQTSENVFSINLHLSEDKHMLSRTFYIFFREFNNRNFYFLLFL